MVLGRFACLNQDHQNEFFPPQKMYRVKYHECLFQVDMGQFGEFTSAFEKQLLFLVRSLP